MFLCVFQDSNGQVAGGGVSVYFSHVLQMLFFSYVQGKSFAATVSRSTTEVQRLFPIIVKGYVSRLPIAFRLNKGNMNVEVLMSLVSFPAPMVAVVKCPLRCVSGLR